MDALKHLRRLAPQAVLGLVIVLGLLSLWQAWDIASHLRDEARQTSRIYGRIVGSLSDPTPGADTDALLDLVEQIRNSGVPLVVTDSTGEVTAAANLPFPEGEAHPELNAYIASLDRINPPIKVPRVGYIHYGQLPIAGRIKWIAILQLGLLLTAAGVGVWAYRTAVRRDRERLWVAMARESAHQMGTPLMSASAWIERLAAGGADRSEIARRLRQDLDRLERVAQRFERIGRPAARERVALGVLAEKIAAYFQPRLPRHANPVILTVHAPGSGPSVTGDPVLLEWALEALVRNSVDALSGRGGHIAIKVSAEGKTASLAVSDDGPGVPAEVLGTLFEPGVTTKTGGWGIGLALVRRIVEDVHGGRLELKNSAQGATFVVHLPIGG